MIEKIKLIAVCLLLLACGSFAQNGRNMQVIAYYSGSNAGLDSVDVKKITHLIFCFGHLKDNRYNVDNAGDTALIRKMVSLKAKNPALKVILSLGGWGGCESCSDAFSTPERRSEFVGSVKTITNYFKTDGIDLDWEYPTIRLDNDIDQNPVHKNTPQDRDNFTSLISQLRKTLGPSSIISFAAGGFNTYLKKAVDWKKIMPDVDYVNLMSYDLINGYSLKTGHHTALYSTAQQAESTDNAVKYLVSIGVDPSKIIIGAAFYARIWENVPANSNGLYQSGKFKQSVAYNQFDSVLGPGSGFAEYWDDTAKAPYSYNRTQQEFATYDNKKSIGLKTRYVSDHKLGGIMFWELSSDTRADGLLDVIVNTKGRY